MNKELLAAFNESIERGKSEEVGSIDTFEVAGQTYFVNKTGRNTYALFEENGFAPLAEKSTAPRRKYPAVRRFDFDFKPAGYGLYKVTYTSPTTGHKWSKTTTDMPLIDATRNAPEPRRKDLEQLKRLCKS